MPGKKMSSFVPGAWYNRVNYTYKETEGDNVRAIFGELQGH